MILLTEYHKSNDIKRHGEFLACLNENISNQKIEYIYLFTSEEVPITSDKIKIVEVKKRPTFAKYFEFANSNLIDKNCVIACADIIFDETIPEHIPKDTVYALTRWSYTPEGNIKFDDNACCQDSWMFNSPINISKLILEEMSFTAGAYWGCDNKIAYLLNKSWIILKNPSKDIITRHLHLSQYRSQTSMENRLQGPFICIEPSSLDENSKLIHIRGFDLLGKPIYL